MVLLKLFGITRETGRMTSPEIATGTGEKSLMKEKMHLKVNTNSYFEMCNGKFMSTFFPDTQTIKELKMP